MAGNLVRVIRSLTVPAIVAAIVPAALAMDLARARQDPGPDPKFTTAMGKGEAALTARVFEDALEAFKKANDMRKKTSAAAFYGICRAYHGLGAFKNAAESCANGLKHVGDDQRLRASLHNQRGMAFFSQAEKSTDRELREAETEFRSALVLAESPPIARYNLGVTLLKQNRDQEGIDALQSYIDSGVRAPEIDLARRMIENPRRGREDFAPDYTFASLAGDNINSRELVGKTVLLDFWGTWCGPCRQATPDLVRLYKKFKDEPFEMLGISSDPSRDREKWIDYIGKTKMDWPQFLDQNKQVIRTFRITAYPTYIVVDTEGIVRIRLQGLGPSTFSQLDTAIKKSIKDGAPKSLTSTFSATASGPFLPPAGPAASWPAARPRAASPSR